jgi:hypothetical protein
MLNHLLPFRFLLYLFSVGFGGFIIFANISSVVCCCGGRLEFIIAFACIIVCSFSICANIGSVFGVETGVETGAGIGVGTGAGTGAGTGVGAGAGTGAFEICINAAICVALKPAFANVKISFAFILLSSLFETV